jgi:hypothetical protein
VVCCCATLVEPAHHLRDGLIHFLARPFFLAVFGERQLGAKNLNAGKEFFQTRDQRDRRNISVETMARDAMQNMVHDTTHGQLRNKVVNVIQKRKKVTQRDLNRALQGHIKAKKDLEQIVEVLQDGGFITIEKKTPKAGGTPTIIYWWSEAD